MWNNRWWLAAVSVAVGALAGGYKAKDLLHPSAPKLVVNGPTTGEPGEPLFFTYAQSTGAPWVFGEIYPRKGELHIEHEPLLQRFRVNGKPGTYRVEISGVNLGGQDKWVGSITIPGETPCPSCPACPDCPKPAPAPLPTPKPTPDPVTPTPAPEPVKPTPVPSPEPPAGRFNVAPEVYRLARTINDPAGCASLAASCRKIADGQHASLNALATEVVKVLGTLSPAWQPLTSKVKASITALYVGGQLQNRDDAAELLREVAGALEGAAK